MCNVVNVYGLMRIIEVVKNYKEPTGGGRRRKLPTEEYVRFASWLERITIPRAEAKAKDAPTLNDTRRQRMKVRTSNVAVQPAPIANQPQAEPTYPTVEEFHERINKLTNGQIDAILATAKCNAEIDGTLTAQAEDAPVQLPVMLTRNHIEDVLQVILDDINAAEEHPGLLTTYGPAIPKVPTTELLEVWLTRVLYDAYVHGMNGTIPDYWKNYERELDPDWKQLKLLAEKFNVELTEVA